MQQSELDSLTTYLAGVFSNRELMVIQHPEDDDQALVAIGQSFFARIERDEDEGELSYNLTKEIPDQPFDELKEHMKTVLNSPAIDVRKRGKKTDSTEVYKGDEFLGLLYDDDGNEEGMQVFNMAILDIDLEIDED
ncbi:MAG: DUF3126 family protein [Pseudomonadota bacterium]